VDAVEEADNKPGIGGEVEEDISFWICVAAAV